MEMEVLISTMNQRDNSIIKKMKIHSDAIIINQCDHNEFSEFADTIKVVKMFSFAERGVGLSRNTAFMRASKDICLFADDDIIYNEEYEKAVIHEFEVHPDADVIIFNLRNSNTSYKSDGIKKFHKVHRYNCLRYGTPQMAVRRENVWNKNIWFSPLFGGGAKYSCGEDSLFLWNCIQRHLRVYAAPITIGMIAHQESTWCKGFTEKFFIDRGCLYYTLSRTLSYLLCIQYAVRKKKLYEQNYSILQACRLMFHGIKLIKN